MHTSASLDERIAQVRQRGIEDVYRGRDRSEDHVRDECGVFGVFGHPEAAKLTYLGLYALQHPRPGRRGNRVFR